MSLVNTIVKGYHIEEEIGEGGFGEVYRATESSAFGREVAIKVIKPQYANHPDFVRRFESEAAIVSRLEHPHIVPLYTYWRDPDGANLVMRWFRGGSLADMLKNGPLELDIVNHIVNQICIALEIAHQNPVIHRDIKPSNILLDEFGNAHLSDFGIAKDLTVYKDDMTQPDTILGSPGYLAPEAARGEVVTNRSDIYSLGVTLYEMLKGKHPFDDVNEIQKIYKHLSDPLPLLDNFEPELATALNEVIQKATAKNPEERYATALEFMEAYQDAVQLSTSDMESVIETLTRGEVEVLQLIVQDKSNKEIAQELFVTVSAVRWHIRNMNKKLRVRSRRELIYKARELGIMGTTDISNIMPVDGNSTFIALPEPENPYKGLQAFTAADGRHFFGREELVQKLLSKMQMDDRHRRFLAVVGPSGSGKSSVVKAGLVPAIWQGKIPGSDRWFVIDFQPGAHPIDELEVALLRVAVDQSLNLNEHLRRDERGLVRIGQLILPQDDSELLIVIDQFEEVFTHVEDETQRQHFLNLVQTAVTDTKSRVRIIITLRADFFDRPLQYPAFAELLRNRMETIFPLSAEQLERVIVQPAKQVGVKFADGLVAAMVSDIHYQAGALPLLQYALTELFEQRQGRLIPYEAYQEIGGAVGALARRADGIFAEMTEAEQALTRQIFMRLVTLGEGTEDTRRRTLLSELQALASDHEIVDEIVDIFAAYRLFSLDHDPITHEPTVEVAHEAILREWERLHTWLNDSREDIKMQRQLASATQEWLDNNAHLSFLLQGKKLEIFENWLKQSQLSLTPTEQEFIENSLAQRQHKADVEAERQVKEARLEKRVQRVLQGLVAVFLFASLLSGCLAQQANEDATEAERQRKIAEQARQEALENASRAEAAEALALLDDGFQDKAIEKGLSAFANADTPEALGALANIVEVYHSYEILSDKGRGQRTRLVLSDDGMRLLHLRSGGDDGEVFQIWDISTHTPTDLTYVLDEVDLGNCDKVICRIDWNSTYNVAILWEDIRGEVLTPEKPIVVNTASGNVMYRLEEDENKITWVDFSSDFETILTVDNGGDITFRSTLDGSIQTNISTEDQGFYQVAWSPDDDLFATLAMDGQIRIWDSATHKETVVIPNDLGHAQVIAWSPDGSMLASAGNDGIVRIWDSFTGKLLSFLIDSTSPLDNIAWSPTGKQIAAHTIHGELLIWNVDTNNLVAKLPIGLFTDVVWSFNGAQIITLGAEGTSHGTLIYDVETSERHLPLISTGEADFVWQASWTPDDEYIYTSSNDGTQYTWDPISLEKVETVYSLSGSNWSPKNPNIIAIKGENNAIQIWDTSTHELLVESTIVEENSEITVNLNMFNASSNSWSPNEAYIALSTSDKEHPIWIVDSQTLQIHTVFGYTLDEECFFFASVWSPDSKRLAASCFKLDAPSTPTLIWDVATGALLQTLQTDTVPWFTRWTPDNKAVIVGYMDGTVRIWDANTGEVMTTLKLDNDDMVNIAVSPDGSFIAFGSWSGHVTIWNTTEEQIHYSFWVSGTTIQDMSWSSDSDYIVIGGVFDPVIKRIWTSKEELIEHAYDCCVNGELTNELRTEYGLPPRNNN